MPIWLTEDPSTIYLLLGVLAFGLLAGYWLKRKPRFLLDAGLVALLAGVVWLVSYLVVTDREQVVQNLGVMAAAASNRDLERVFSHIAKEFKHGTMDKAAFRQAAERALRQHNVRNIRIWDLEPGEIARDARSGQIAFKVKVDSNFTRGAEFYLCRAEFVLDPDGQWRMKGFQIFNPFVNTDQPLPIPGL